MTLENPASSRAKVASDQNRFDWPVAFAAERFLRDRVDAFFVRNSFARQLAGRMRDETATDFFEWIDHLALTPEDETALRRLGFVTENVSAGPGETVLEQPETTLPRIILDPRAPTQSPTRLALRPEFLEDFVRRLAISTPIEGGPGARWRRVIVAEETGTTLEAIERHACRGFVAPPAPEGDAAAMEKVRALWHGRQREFADDQEGFVHANGLLNEVLSLVDRDLACALFFEAERAYWQGRNAAAKVQKERQDRLGLGWGNHDHHTFRCSRRHFVDLIEFLERLGFGKRERYYAGAEAGWGAQISEQRTAGIVVFADVDLQPEEVQVDFSSHRLPSAPKLGTVGLWVGLHGESFLQAGMHHLECRFDFKLLRDQLKGRGIGTMNPFSNFEFLRQAFTEGERWPVNRARAEKLLHENLITEEQFLKFINDGALGSHLENLQRHGGFKGFNQTSVSAIIAATDPRKTHFSAAA
jgi:hypothetical protein